MVFIAYVRYGWPITIVQFLFSFKIQIRLTHLLTKFSNFVWEYKFVMAVLKDKLKH